MPIKSNMKMINHSWNTFCIFMTAKIQLYTKFQQEIFKQRYLKISQIKKHLHIISLKLLFTSMSSLDFRNTRFEQIINSSRGSPKRIFTNF